MATMHSNSAALLATIQMIHCSKQRGCCERDTGSLMAAATGSTCTVQPPEAASIGQYNRLIPCCMRRLLQQSKEGRYRCSTASQAAASRAAGSYSPAGCNKEHRAIQCKYRLCLHHHSQAPDGADTGVCGMPGFVQARDASKPSLLAINVD
jgi:hypothetical protein